METVLYLYAISQREQAMLMQSCGQGSVNSVIAETCRLGS